MFRPNPAIIRFSSERVSVFISTMRLCNDGEISSSVVLIITIIQTVAGEGVSIIVIIKTTDDEISPSLHNRIDLINTDTLSDENLTMALLGRNM